MVDLTGVSWRKASRSTSNGGDCVELARITNAVAIRDSKDPRGPKLFLTPENFQHLAEALKNA